MKNTLHNLVKKYRKLSEDASLTPEKRDLYKKLALEVQTEIVESEKFFLDMDREIYGEKGV